MNISYPVVTLVVGSLDRSHAGLPMLVTQPISHSVGLSSGAKQVSEVSVGFDIAERKQHDAAQEYHRLPHSLVVSSPARPPLQEEDEVRDIVGHLGSRSRGAILVLDQSVMQLTRHTNDHVIEVAE